MLNRCWGGGDFGFEFVGLVVQGDPRVESMQEALGSITVVAEAKRGHETGQEVSRVRRGSGLRTNPQGLTGLGVPFCGPPIGSSARFFLNELPPPPQHSTSDSVNFLLNCVV